MFGGHLPNWMLFVQVSGLKQEFRGPYAAHEDVENERLYLKKMWPLNTCFGLCAAREALEGIWV